MIPTVAALLAAGVGLLAYQQWRAGRESAEKRRRFLELLKMAPGD